MQEEQVVVFKIGSSEYGVPITDVQEIIKIPHITALPDVPDYVEGIINLRGKIMPVLDLQKKLKHNDCQALNNDSRVIVLNLPEQSIGVIVDEVSEVLKIPADVIEPPPQVVGCDSNNAIYGIGKIKGRLLILLNMEEALSMQFEQDNFNIVGM